jgi:hypothetical protein
MSVGNTGGLVPWVSRLRWLSIFLYNGAVMAQKIQTLFIDDLDGSEAEGTVRFGLDGVAYEIELSAVHAKALRKSVEKYVRAGHKVTPRRPGRSNGRRGANGSPNSTDVRERAKSQGIAVKGRGRVSSELLVQFQAATGV